MRLIIPKTRTGRAFPAPDGSDADPPFTRRFHPARAERPRPAAAKGPACRPARHRDGPHPRRPARAACAAPPGRAPPALGCSWSPPRAHARHLCCPARSGQTPAPDPRTPLRSQPAPSVHAPKQRETVQSPPTTMRPPPPRKFARRRRISRPGRALRPGHSEYRAEDSPDRTFRRAISMPTIPAARDHAFRSSRPREAADIPEESCAGVAPAAQAGQTAPPDPHSPPSPRAPSAPAPRRREPCQSPTQHHNAADHPGGRAPRACPAWPEQAIRRPGLIRTRRTPPRDVAGHPRKLALSHPVSSIGRKRSGGVAE